MEKEELNLSPEILEALNKPDETEEEFIARLKKQEDIVDKERELKMARLDARTPLVMQLAEKKLANQRLDELEEEVELLEDNQQDHETLTMSQLLEREYPAEGWIIEKFLPTEGIVLFSGDAGVGKSFLLLEIVRSLVMNDIFLDHFEIKTSNVPILMIDKENGSRRIQKRAKGMGIPPTNNVHLLEFPEKFNLDDESFTQSVSEFIKAQKIGIVLVDSFIDILIGDENSPTDTAKIFNSLRSIAPNILWVLLHHEVKPVAKYTPLAINRARGSSNIKAQVDYLFSLQKTKSPKIIQIEQGKARDYEMLLPFAVEFQTVEGTEEMGGFKYLGEIQSEVSKVDDAAGFIMNFLSLNPNSSRKMLIDAAEGQGITQSSTRRGIDMLKEKMLIDSKLDLIDKRKQLFFIKEMADEEENVDHLLGFIDET